MDKLYYGENLNVLREHIAKETVDLIYLDPPFNFKRDYNLHFKSPKKICRPVGSTGETSEAANSPAAGTAVPQEDFSEAQITAFEDSWHAKKEKSGQQLGLDMG